MKPLMRWSSILDALRKSVDIADAWEGDDGGKTVGFHHDPNF